ncbi:MAG: isoprenoid biosynthesis glyoxalase ElbB, partial [Halobacteriovoraceae bacterium]|nr:isoprenoid biosynthesis glyoxalase ElbB [Halobacteriovoraceae bacterium]
MDKKNIAVILSGSGYLDGSEISEAVLTLLALDKSKEQLNVRCLAPDREQARVINHLTEKAMDEKRNILIESARIARGKIEDIQKVNPEDFHGVIIPGGFGAALNLCDFGVKGSAGHVIKPLADFIGKYRQGKNRPLGAVCIAPAIVALLLGGDKAVLTIGEDRETAMEIEKTGATHRNCPVDNIVVDENLKVVTSPAYMYGDSRLNEIAIGIDKC